MKHLTHYTEEKISQAIEKAGAFFAFSEEHFKEKATRPREDYTNGFCGLVCPKDTIAQLYIDFAKIHKEGIAEDIAENGLEAIAIRELNNHECYYSGDIQNALGVLGDYGLSEDDVEAIFKNKNHVFTK